MKKANTESLRTLVPVQHTRLCGHLLRSAKGFRAFDSDDREIGGYPTPDLVVAALLGLASKCEPRCSFPSAPCSFRHNRRRHGPVRLAARVWAGRCDLSPQNRRPMTERREAARRHHRLTALFCQSSSASRFAAGRMSTELLVDCRADKISRSRADKISRSAASQCCSASPLR